MAEGLAPTARKPETLDKVSGAEHLRAKITSATASTPPSATLPSGSVRHITTGEAFAPPGAPKSETNTSSDQESQPAPTAEGEEEIELDLETDEESANTEGLAKINSEDSLDLTDPNDLPKRFPEGSSVVLRELYHTDRPPIRFVIVSYEPDNRFAKIKLSGEEKERRINTGNLLKPNEYEVTLDKEDFDIDLDEGLNAAQ